MSWLTTWLSSCFTITACIGAAVDQTCLSGQLVLTPVLLPWLFAVAFNWGLDHDLFIHCVWPHLVHGCGLFKKSFQIFLIILERYLGPVFCAPPNGDDLHPKNIWFQLESQNWSLTSGPWRSVSTCLCEWPCVRRKKCLLFAICCLHRSPFTFLQPLWKIRMSNSTVINSSLLPLRCTALLLMSFWWYLFLKCVICAGYWSVWLC